VIGGMGKALITGASAGIGEVFARRLSERGDDLVLVARRSDRLHALRDELTALHGIAVDTLVANLAARDELQRVVRRVGEGDITLLVNNAGINGYGPFAQVDPAVLEGVLAVNVTAPLLLARAAVPAMLDAGGGAIVNVSSLLAFSGGLAPDPLPVRATYAGTKGFMVTFSRTLAAELADTPVRVQVLCPGYTATEFHMTSGTEPVQGTAPPDQPHAMSAEDVVQASLAALQAGEVVCIPGLDDHEAVEHLARAETELRQGGRAALAARYAAR
jgi:short-subunit dehydrogenase